MAPTKERMLRLSIAHYRNPDCSEEECHRFVSQDHAMKAARIHKRHNVDMYGFYYSPTPTREILTKATAALQNGWVVDDHDLTVEFYFRDINAVFKVAQDPEFKALQAEEAPFICRDRAVASLGWVETYIEDNRIVNVGDDGKPLYGSYQESSEVRIDM